MSQHRTWIRRRTWSRGEHERQSLLPRRNFPSLDRSVRLRAAEWRGVRGRRRSVRNRDLLRHSASLLCRLRSTRCLGPVVLQRCARVAITENRSNACQHCPEVSAAVSPQVDDPCSGIVRQQFGDHLLNIRCIVVDIFPLLAPSAAWIAATEKQSPGSSHKKRCRRMILSAENTTRRGKR